MAAIPVLAVALGHHRRGVGRLLKSEALRLLAASGYDLVTSVVHEDNEPMIQLNASLGAHFERDPANPEYLLCVIDIALE